MTRCKGEAFAIEATKGGRECPQQHAEFTLLGDNLVRGDAGEGEAAGKLRSIKDDGGGTGRLFDTAERPRVSADFLEG